MCTLLPNLCVLPLVAGLMPYNHQKGEARTDFLTHEAPSLSPSSLPIEQQEQKHRQTKKKKIPFDDYHALWQGLATTVPAYDPNNECMWLCTCTVLNVHNSPLCDGGFIFEIGVNVLCMSE